MENIYLESLNYKQIIELNKIYLNRKKKFVIYLNNFISAQDDLIGISPIFSRNIDLSRTYYYYCLLILIKQINKNKKNIRIVTSNYILFKFLKKNVKQTYKLKVFYTGSKLNKIKYYFSNILKFKRFFFQCFF